MRKWIGRIVTAIVMTSAVGAVSAQEGVIADGLNNPRGIAFDSDGTLYVAEVGLGGDFDVEGNFGPALAGGTGSVTTISADGTRSLMLTGLPSRNEGGEIVGSSRAIPQGDLLWVLFSQGTLTSPFTYGVAALDRATNRVQHWIDVYSAEASQNPDGGLIDSNPVDIAWDSAGRLYIADAGCNCIWRSDAEYSGALEVFSVWSDNPVPTSIEISPADEVFVGFLTGFPFVPESARVEQWTTDGTLVTTFTGLTAVVDLLWLDGEIYATEFARFDMASGWTPDTGRVVRVTTDGPVVVAEGLNLPYGIAIAPAGNLVAAVNSAYSPDGSGMIVSVSPEIAGMGEG